MAQKKSESSEKTNVRRIKAVDDKPKVKSVQKTEIKKASTEPSKKVAKKGKKSSKKPSQDLINEPTKNPFKALGRYFKGSWYELRQVRWPNRAATWSLTLAVLVFTGFFVLLVVLLDSGFNWVFEQLLR